MPKRALWIAALCVAIGGAASLAVGADRPVPIAQALVNCDTGTADLDGEEQAMVALVNAERAKYDLAPLAVSPNLNRAAAWKSEDSSNVPPQSHTDSQGRVFQARFRDCGYVYPRSENILYGAATAQSAFGPWMQSALHRANILDPSAVAIGVGRSGVSWTQAFGTVDDSGLPPETPAPSPSPSPSPSPTAPPSTSIPLPAGLSGLEYDGPAAPPQEVFASLGDTVAWVYSWNGAAARWDRYSPGAPGYVNTLEAVVPGGQYFMWLWEPATLAY